MNTIFRLLNCLNRDKITLSIGTIVLSLGVIYPWYLLPPEALKAFETNLFLTNLWRVLAALFVILSFAFTFWFNLKRAPRLIFWSGLVAVLLFPYLVTTWSPNIDFLSVAYYNQQKQVKEHVESNYSDVQAQWKQNILLKQSTPISSIFEYSIKDSRFFQISSWDKVLIEDFGYSNSFFGFIGRGWAFTAIGITIGLLAFYLGLENDKLNVFITDMSKLLPWVGIGFSILVFSLILPNITNYQTNTMFAKGEYHQTVASSQSLMSMYPPLSGDEAFLQRLAEAEFYDNASDPALIYFAKGLERYRQGDFLKAEDYFQKSLNLQPKRFLVRGYLATTILNQGVKYFNDPNNLSSHKSEAAAECFEQALRIFPGHIQALYYLMLARVVNGEFEKSASVAQQVIQSQQYSQQPNLALLGQARLHVAWDSFHNEDTTQAWNQYRQSIDSSTWNKSGEAEE